MRLDILRSILSLLQVNSQVIKPQERALLARLVEIMVSLELRFVQERAEDGQMVYRLDPSVSPNLASVIAHEKP